MKMFFRLLLILVLLSGGIATAASLEVGRQPIAMPKELPGVYTLVLIGEADAHSSNPERAAILDREGDAYSFQPVTPDYRVKRVSGLTAAAALSAAEKFFAGHCAYNGYRVNSLVLSNGVTVGEELVPDYPVTLCEYGNVVSVGYAVGDQGVIKVYTKLLLPVVGGRSLEQDGLGKRR